MYDDHIVSQGVPVVQSDGGEKGVRSTCASSVDESVVERRKLQIRSKWQIRMQRKLQPNKETQLRQGQAGVQPGREATQPPLEPTPGASWAGFGGTRLTTSKNAEGPH